MPFMDMTGYLTVTEGLHSLLAMQSSLIDERYGNV